MEKKKLSAKERLKWFNKARFGVFVDILLEKYWSEDVL